MGFKFYIYKMKKQAAVALLLFFFFGKTNAQNINIEAKLPFSNNLTIETDNPEAAFALKKGLGVEGSVSFVTLKKHDVSVGIDYFQAEVNEERKIQSFSGVFKAGGELFSKFFTDEDFKIMFFAGGKSGIGKYTFSTGDDIYISLGIEAGFKIKYKNIYCSFFQTNTKGIQEPKGGQNSYNTSCLGVSLGAILF